MCQWADNFSRTLRGAYWCCCWNFLSCARKWIWSLKFIAEVLPFRITNTPIVSQHLFHTKTKLRKLWSVSLCWTNMLRRREDWCSERCFDLTTWDVSREWSSNAFMRNDAYFGDWNKLIWVLSQIIHVNKVIDTSHNIECQALKNSWVALQYWFANILRTSFNNNYQTWSS